MQITRVVFFAVPIMLVLWLNAGPSALAAPKSVGVVLANQHGRVVYAKNSDVPLVPASILKIVTALAAIHYLGQDFRYETRFYYDSKTQDLTVKGFGDPLFVSEAIEAFSGQVASAIEGRSIRHVILDRSYFDPVRIPGTSNDALNPYNASNGALSANFNTVFFQWDSKQNRFISAEPQTPLLDVFLDEVTRTGLKKGRIVLSEEAAGLYPGLLIRYFLTKQGVRVTGEVKLGGWGEDESPGEAFVSTYSLDEIITKLMEYSNNYMANQLLLTIGARVSGGSATLDKGVSAVTSFLKDTVGIEAVKLSEGSGISRDNRLSCTDMLKVLLAFRPYHQLLRNHENDFYKTGTLHRVRTRAGYLMGEDRRLYPYVVMINGSNHGSDPILQDLQQRVKNIDAKAK